MIRLLRPGLCLCDSRMTVTRNLTIGISLLDLQCLLWVQYCFFYQFSCIVADSVCGTMFAFVITSSVLLSFFKFKVLCCAQDSLTIQVFSGIPLFGFIAHIQATVHGTDLSDILIVVRFGIAFAVTLWAHWNIHNVLHTIFVFSSYMWLCWVIMFLKFCISHVVIG